MLRGRRDWSHRLGFTVTFTFAAVLQPFIGHIVGTRLDTQQPSKLAAMDLVVETEGRAPALIGGVLIDGEVRGAIKIPVLGSILAGNSLDTVITGFDQIPPDERPPANVAHIAFRLMVASRLAMIAIVGWSPIRRRRTADPFESRWFLRAVAALMFLGVVAYAILGGADFGSGVWDLLAGDARQGHDRCRSGSQINIDRPDRGLRIRGPHCCASMIWLFILVNQDEWSNEDH